MSGFVGIVDLTGRPVDRPLLERMTESLAFRGPDGRKVWSAGSVGLGHALLRTTFESEAESQPCTLDGEVWIAADARIDDRAELTRKLAARGLEAAGGVSDVELILNAYQAWGADCLEHLLGDFAFAIWDGPQRRLFCARDHFGLKPFYYAQLGELLLLSNTLSALRLAPAVSDRLDDLALADWLMFGYNRNPSTTAFRDIRRLPAAHRLIWQAGAPRISRYWELPQDEQLRYRRADDYVDHFNEVFTTAVEDRLRWKCVGISMSGGVDSSAVAAAARHSPACETGQVRLHAYTLVFDRLIPDEERRWAGSVAEHIGLPIYYATGDDYRFGERWREPESFHPEPGYGWLSGLGYDFNRAISSETPVLLGGMGGDPINRGSSACYAELVRRLQIRYLATDLWRTVRAGHRPPLLARTLWRRWRGQRRRLQEYPGWLEEGWAETLGLPTRWREMHGNMPAGWSARSEIQDLFWPALFECYDPAWSRFPIELRQPFFDLRVVRYMLRIPTLPWSLNKHVVRSAMRGKLPQGVRRRPKTPLAENPTHVMIREEGFTLWRKIFAAAPSIERFVDSAGVVEEAQEHLQRRGKDLDAMVRALSLAVWLYHLEEGQKA